MKDARQRGGGIQREEQPDGQSRGGEGVGGGTQKKHTVLSAQHSKLTIYSSPFCKKVGIRGWHNYFLSHFHYPYYFC